MKIVNYKYGEPEFSGSESGTQSEDLIPMQRYKIIKIKIKVV